METDLQENIGTKSCTWWNVQMRGRSAVVVCVPAGSTRSEIAKAYTGASELRPINPKGSTPQLPLSCAQERAIRTWLAGIEESDQTVIAAVIDASEQDAVVLSYYLGRAGYDTGGGHGDRR